MKAQDKVAKEGRGRSGGKVILFGEHSVVYGHPALAAGLGRGVQGSARITDESILTVEPWELRLSPEDDVPLAQAFRALLQTYGETPPMAVHLKVELPGGAGLGCSAAMGVAASEAIDDLLDIPRTAEARGEQTLAWERVFHGNPSGVDNAMAAAGGIAVFRRGQPLQRVHSTAPLPLVVAHSGESSSTKEVVAMIARQHERDTARVDQAFEAISTLVENARSAILVGELKSVGQLMMMNQRLLAGLMLSTERIEALCRAAEEAGALGAKLTGAGAGGCVIALAESMEHAKELEKAMAPLASMTLACEAGVRLGA